MDRFVCKFTFTRGLKRKKPEHPQLDDDTREYPSSSLIAILKRKLKTCEAYTRRLEKRVNHLCQIHREDRAALEYERKMRHAAEEQLAMSPGVAMIQEAEVKWTALCTEQSTLQNKLSVAESQLQLVPARLEEILREVARVTGSPEQGVFEHFRHFVDCSLVLEIETRSDDMDVEVSVVQLPTQVVLQPTQVVFHQPQYQPPPPPHLQPQFEFLPQPNPQFQPQPQLQSHPQFEPQFQPQPHPFQPHPHYQPQSQLQPQPEEQPLYRPQSPLELQPQQQHQPPAVCLQPNPNAHPDSHPSPPLPTPAPSPHSTRPTFTHPTRQIQTEDYFSPRAERAPLWSVPGAGDDANFDCARTEDNTSDEEDGEDDSDEDGSDDGGEDSDDESDDDEDRPTHRPSNTRRVDLSIRMPKQTQPMPPGVGDTSGLPTP